MQQQQQQPKSLLQSQSMNNNNNDNQITTKEIEQSIGNEDEFYEQNDPTLKTWFVIFLFGFTDIWLVVIATLAFVELNDCSFIIPLLFTIFFCILNFLFFFVWILLYFRGFLVMPDTVNVVIFEQRQDVDYVYLNRLQQRSKKEFMYIIVEKPNKKHYLVPFSKPNNSSINSNNNNNNIRKRVTEVSNTEKMDLCSLSYSDYVSCIYTSLRMFVLYFFISSAVMIIYCARFGDSGSTAISDILVSTSAQTWNNTMSCLFSLSIVVFYFELIATWKYWALVWSCYDPMIYKNPFYPDKTTLFNIRYHQDTN
jgi:hypothetical protein